jgi:glycosyltransferase involved in cell wall biosynthesis
MQNARMSARELVRPYYLRWLYFRLFPAARPAEFVDCWKFPTFPLSAASLASELPSGTLNPSFLFYPMTDLHARVQRTTHFADALASRGHISYVLNPHLGRQYPSVYLADSSSKLGILRPRLAELHVRLRAEPVYHCRMLTPDESGRLAEELSVLGARSNPPVAQILSLPTWLDAALALRTRFGWPIIYDCHDLIEGFQGISRDIVEAETRLFENADLVLFSSRQLFEQQAGRGPSLRTNFAMLRNATDASHFAEAARKREQRRSGARVVGYFGALDNWFDIGLIQACAARFPNLKFRLIGRIEHAPIRTLAQLPNVELLGEIPYEKLPEGAACFDVALIPFHITPLTLATNPIKLYEYFSCGLPVVSTPLPEVELFEGLAYIGANAQVFGDGILRALEEEGLAKHLQRIEVARRETWDARAGELLDAVSSLFHAEAHLERLGALKR